MKIEKIEKIATIGKNTIERIHPAKEEIVDSIISSNKHQSENRRSVPVKINGKNIEKS